MKGRCGCSGGEGEGVMGQGEGVMGEGRCDGVKGEGVYNNEIQICDYIKAATKRGVVLDGLTLPS